MNKVLVICSSFRNYGECFRDAFIDNQCDTILFKTPMMGIKRYHFLTRIKRKLGLDISNYYKKSRETISKKILKCFDLVKPDIVFVNLGNTITCRDLKKIQEKSKLILYLPDPLSKVEEIKPSLCLYDKIYTFEKTDIFKIAKLTEANVSTLFGLFDPKVYFPLQLEKVYDIYFVGALYPFRVQIIIQLIKDFPSLNFFIDGNYSDFPESKKMISKLKREQKAFFSNKNITSQEANIKYNQSKIVLNLQHPQTKDGWNSRLTEILGSKSFEIVTNNDSVKKAFNDCLETYSNYKELKEKESK